MAWRYSGRATTSPGNPRAFAVCDRCGMWYNHHKLTPQKEWAGTRLVNLNLLVCSQCLDVPQVQLKARILPPDPVPILNARVENFAADNNTYLTTDDGKTILTNDGNNLVVN